jgi:diguanylate cyclase (GGDEF)-like protein
MPSHDSNPTDQTLTMIYNDTTIAELLDGTYRKPRLLLVDDQPINIQVLHPIFATEYQVFMATSGPQALAICRVNPPDLMLLDVMMPVMDGFEVCRLLKADESTRNIPIIFVTAHDDTRQETRGLELGAVDFISKPVNPAVVRARVKTHVTLKLQTDMMRKLIYLDGLTGVYNRRYFDQQLATEMARSVRNQSQLSLIMLDVDYFKRYNDHYGHQAGDDCLRQIATALKAGLKRPADLIARYGGEEFACILPETPLADAMALARELELSIRKIAMAHERSETTGVVTISLGVSCREQLNTDNPSTLLAEADKQLYRAKSTGRGRVCGTDLNLV